MSVSVLQKNLAFSLSLLFAASAANSAESPTPVATNFFKATTAQETFSAQGTKNGVDYSDSTSIMSITLKDGNGTNTATGSGYASGDTVDSSIKNLIGPNSAGNLGYNILVGNAAANMLWGIGGSKNTLDGGAGSDTLVGSPTGWNWARYTSSPAGVTVNLEAGVGLGSDAEGDTLYNIDAVDGSKFGDTLIGTENNPETLRGNKGNNYMDPKGGDDTSIGDIDSDTYVYTSGNATIQEATAGAAGHSDTVMFSSKWSPRQALISNNTLTLEATKHSITFNDINLIEKFSFAGYPSMTPNQLKTVGNSAPNPLYEASQMASTATESFKGQFGDTVDYTFSTAPVTVSLDGNVAGSGGYASNDIYDDKILNIVGADTPASAGYNKLTGDDASNRLYGLGSSKNYLDGRGGADTLVGSLNGWNWAIYSSSPEGVTINLATNVNTGGHAQGDMLYNIDAVKTSSYDDHFTGDAQDNTFDGSSGMDTAHFKGKFAEYTVISSNGGLVIKDNIAGRDGTDTYTNTETYVFSDGTYVAGIFRPTQPAAVTAMTLQAKNSAGYSQESEINLIGQHPSGSINLGLTFTSPNTLENGQCIAVNPVTNYRLNTASFDSNNTVIHNASYTFEVTDPDLYCHDKVDQYNEQCGVFEQECDIVLPIVLP